MSNRGNPGLPGGHRLSDTWLDIAPFRNALRQHLNNGGRITELSRRMYDDPTRTTQIMRMAGLKPTHAGRPAQRGRLYYNRRIHYDNAVKLIRALGLDPVDYGL